MKLLNIALINKCERGGITNVLLFVGVNISTTGRLLFDESPRSQVWIPSYIAYGLVDTMAPLYGVMAPMAGNLGM